MNSEEMNQLIDSIKKDGLNIEITVNGRKIEGTQEDFNRILRSLEKSKLSERAIGTIFNFAGHDWIILERSCDSVKCLSLNIVGESYYGISWEYRQDKNLCYENSNIKKQVNYHAREMYSKCAPGEIKYVGLLPREQYLRNKHIIERNLPPNGERWAWWLAERFYPRTDIEAFNCAGHEWAYAACYYTDGEPHLGYARIDHHIGIRLYGIFSAYICV